jgi:hypothetical protein
MQHGNETGVGRRREMTGVQGARVQAGWRRSVMKVAAVNVQFVSTAL